MPCLRARMISVRGTYLNVSRHSELLSVSVALGRPTRVRAQRGLLERAIANLVDNALKFSDEPDGVEITVDGPVIEVADRGRASTTRTAERSSGASTGRTTSAHDRGRASGFQSSTRSPRA